MADGHNEATGQGGEAQGGAERVTDVDRKTAAEIALPLVRQIAAALAGERAKARAPFLAILDEEPTMQPLWEFERGALRGIEMCKSAIRRAAEETE